MGPSYATIIVPIVDGRADALKRYIATYVDPQPGADGALVCQPQFPFDAVATLHFMSFLILATDPDEGLPAQLVLDVTFDGDQQRLFHQLVGAAAAGMHHIYSHCVGYPVAGANPPSTAAFVSYLRDHDVGADTFFSGCFGHTAARIKQEHVLRGALRTELDRQRASPLPMPPTNAGLQASLQTLVRNDPSLSWATSAPPQPWLMQHRTGVAVGVVAALTAVLALAGCGLLLPWNIGPSDLYAAALASPAWVSALGGRLAGSWPVITGVLLLALLVLALRLAALVGAEAGNPSRRHVPLRDALGFLALPLLLAGIVTYAIVLALIGVELLVADAVALPAAAAREIANARALLLGDGSNACLRSLGLFGVGLLVLAVLAHADTTLAIRLDRVPGTHVLGRRLLRSALGLAEAAVIALMVIAVLWPWRSAFRQVIEAVAIVGGVLGAVLIAALAGASLLYAIVALFLLVVRIKEHADLAAFQPASDLMDDALGNRAARAREEGGINALQNHLASLTYVKPGRFRLVALQLTLALIGLLARIWFNKGDLGGISTILSARWALIDKGRRLIFLDNYGGGWESYLNEFIDMSAVIGLNAIWTNTFIKRPPPSAGQGPAQRYAFPATQFYTSGGARDERPFKTYVRYSQIETLSWYGAYHRQSIININANGRIRRDLFQPLQSHEVDSLVGKL